MTSPLISVDQLAGRLGDADLVLLDVRWTLGRDDGRQRYLEGHIPGARYIDLDHELGGPPSAAAGRHPLPRRDDFEATLRRLGVTGASTVVAYDQAQSFSAARLWWLLRNAGLDGAVVLDGGLDAWLTGGHPLETGEPDAAHPGDVVTAWNRLPTIGIDEAARFEGTLLDARAAERFRGEVEPIDPKAGHIPGAVSAPTSDNLDESGRFLPANILSERFRALALDDESPVAVYCGSGVTASHQILALEIAGIPAALFPGSWSQWSNDPDRPIATGG